MKSHYNNLFEDMRKYAPKYAISMILTFLVLLYGIISPKFFEVLVDKGISAGSISHLIQIAVIFACITLLSNVFQYILKTLNRTIANQYIKMKRRSFLELSCKQSGSSVFNQSSGKALRIFEYDISNTGHFVVDFAIPLLRDALQALIAAGMLLCTNSLLFGIILIIQSIIIYINKRISKNVENKTSFIYKKKDTLSEIIQDFFAKLPYIIRNGFDPFFINKASDCSADELDSEKDRLSLIVINALTSDYLSTISTLLVYILGGVSVINGNMTLGGLIAYNLYVSKVTQPMLSISSSLVDFKDFKESIKRVYSVSFLKNDPAENPHLNFNKAIVFEDVDFSYDSDKTLQGINLTIPKGKIIAIVGESGSGKSTVINLISRLWQPTAGTIYLDDTDINSISLSAYRNICAFASQNNEIFADTVKANLTMGKEIDFDEIIRITKLVGIYDFIMQLPDKFDNILLKNGGNLSEGQKQRISLARVLLKPFTEIIVLDEITSNLDFENQSIVKNAIIEESAKKTFVILSHQWALVNSSDYIYVLKNGQIVEEGSLKYLEEKDGEFCNLFLSMV